jgi:cation diffusion facilitator CzcD-associated flavoprotein CzcO
MSTPDVDVLIIGAGISGIGAAVHLQKQHPERTYAILEGREALGGTWDLFHYPGVRSDSDLHTFCYAFKPWIDEQSIADGPAILRYLKETAAEYGVDDRIRFRHRVRAARWASRDCCWTVEAERGPEAEPVKITARWLFCAGGYYRYDRGHKPDLAGIEHFGGKVVHPQCWPEDLDWADREVVVIGSGATAITLVPALAERASHVTMLQRTPTYVVSIPAVDPLNALVKRTVGPVRAHRFSRWMNVRLDKLIFAASRRYPRQVRRLIRKLNVRALPEGYDVDTHFNPPYDPWSQRMCLARDGDLFGTIRDGRAIVITDRIAGFDASGIKLESGARIDADIVVTATGLEMVPLADVAYSVDGRPVELAETVAYKGMMLSGIPNFVYALGYTNASWTLKVDLTCEHFCRLLALMNDRGYDCAIPEPPPPGAPTAPLFDLGSGYVTRAVGRFPRQGSQFPWLLKMDYLYDREVLLDGPVGDRMQLRRAPARATAEVTVG